MTTPPSTSFGWATRRWAAALFALLASASCSPAGGPEPSPDTGGPQGPTPQAEIGTVQDLAVVDASEGFSGPLSVLPVTVGTAELIGSTEAGLEPAQALRTYSLKERFLGGQRLRRRLRIEERFELRYDAPRPAQVRGSSELTREYTVDVEEATVGQILRATVDVASDTRRVLPVGEIRPRLAVSAGPLLGARLSCLLAASGRYQCTMPGAIGPLRDLGGIAPQRIGMWPGKMIAVTESWELRGRDAENFLETEGADAVVRFVLEDPSAAYRDEECRRVAYSIDGTQQVSFSGSNTQASLTGRGEFYYCQDHSAVLFHIQERSLSMQTMVNHGLEPGWLARDVTFVMEEETTIER